MLDILEELDPVIGLKLSKTRPTSPTWDWIKNVFGYWDNSDIGAQGNFQLYDLEHSFTQTWLKIQEQFFKKDGVLFWNRVKCSQSTVKFANVEHCALGTDLVVQMILYV